MPHPAFHDQSKLRSFDDYLSVIKLLFAHDRALSVKKFASGGGIGPWIETTLLYVKT